MTLHSPFNHADAYNFFKSKIHMHLKEARNSQAQRLLNTI